ncbi:MAG: hypothetical protein K0Q79_284 [Flavipsychrobacter sp.]|jgi:putative addiction module component (TIGR02574 family)|nr:hypothetical protein [Flavipsychrobacter sp.]
MSTAELKELKKEIKKYIEHADERAVRMVYGMIEADSKNERDTYQLTPEQEAILDRRMERDKKGLTKYSTWEEVEKRIKQKAKKHGI